MLDVLIVESDTDSRTALAAWIGGRGMRCRTAADMADANAALAERTPDLALLDLALLNGNGPALLDRLHASPGTKVVTILDHAIAGADDATRGRAIPDCLTRPVSRARLSTILADLAARTARRRDQQRMRGELRDAGHYGNMVGTSDAMLEVYDSIERVAPTDETVLLTGPTGTGKELAAALLHRLSRRADGPFVALNCGAIPAALIESELFGHERGSFTGATQQHKGVFEQAEGGTLFLDEITEMSRDMQARLLRVLETGVLTRVGGSGPLGFDVRILAATNRDPRAAVAAGVLRQDVLYRLDVFSLSLPPLQARGDDLTLLSRSFLTQLNELYGTTKTFTPSALAALRARDWPGNVRQLRNAVRRAWIMSGETVGAADVGAGEPARPPGAGSNEVVLRPGTRIRDAERQLIEATLSHVNGNKHTASDLLGISVKTLYTRLSLYAAAR
jgi:DNA-binding NtrC family response regulator